MQTRVDLGADGATFTRVSRWGDGPKTGTVTITTVSLFDTTGASVTHAMVRKGRAVETWTETVSLQAHNGPED